MKLSVTFRNEFKADLPSIKVLRTVSGGGRPLTDDEPEIEAGEGRGVVTGSGDVL